MTDEHTQPADGRPLELVPCPLCGKQEGYRLDDGATYRWWRVTCLSCGECLAECRSNLSTRFGAALPDQWLTADVAWNAAGAYADGLRKALGAALQALHEIAEEWAGAECGEPVHAQEAYAIGLAKRMYGISAAALRPNV
jgi:ferredoxin